MTDVSAWAEIDDSNNGVSPAGWPEGMMPSGVNNSARAMMGALKRWRDQSQPTVSSTGTANAQVITYPVAPATLATGDVFAFVASYANTTAPTLTINGQGPHPIRHSNGAVLTGGELTTNAVVLVSFILAEGFRLLAASTPVSIANGGTGSTSVTAGPFVQKAGDTMTGQLNVPGIAYSEGPYPLAHRFGFAWDGSNTHVVVDGTDMGLVGDVTSVTAGNGLTGGGSSGALTLSLVTPVSIANGGTGTTSGAVPLTGGTMTGPLTISLASGSDPLRLNVVGGQFDRIQYTIAGVRSWSAGVHNNGSFVIGDETNGSANLIIDTSGNVTCPIGITSGAIISHGNITCDYQLTSGTFYTSGNQPAGSWQFWVTDAIHVNSHMVPAPDAWWQCGNATYAWAFVESWAYYTKSDPSVKRDIEPVPPHCLDLVNAIEPKTYKLNTKDDSDRTHWGFMAPEVNEAMARAGVRFDGVKTEGDAPSSLAYNEMVAVLWGACREMGSELAEMRARLEELETKGSA